MQAGGEANNGDNGKIIPRIEFLTAHLIFYLCHEQVMLHYIKSWFHFISEYPIVASLLFASSLPSCNCRINPPSACCLTAHVSRFQPAIVTRHLVNKQTMGYANPAYWIPKETNAFLLYKKTKQLSRDCGNIPAWMIYGIP